MTGTTLSIAVVLFSTCWILLAIRWLLRRSVAAFEDVASRIASGDTDALSETGLFVPGAVRYSNAVRAMALTLQARHDELRKSEERFRLIAETVTEVFWLADVDIQTMVYVSPAYEQVWGRSCASLYANPRSFIEAMHPEDRPRIMEALGVKKLGQPFEHEYRIRRPDGTERWISDRGYPLWKNAGRPNMYVGVAQDVTDRVRTERAHRDIEERMRFALQAARLGVWDADLRTGSSFWSDTCEALHGLAPGTFGGTFEAFIERIHPDDREAVRTEIERAVAGRRQAKFEYRTIWPDGSSRWIVSTARFFYDESGAPIRGAGISADVSEQRSLEEQLRHAQRVETLGQFAGGIAHDFNNVLTAILGNADFMLNTLPSEDTRRADVDEIAKAANRGTALTRRLLAFSRKEPLELRAFRVGDLVGELVPMLRRLLGERIDIVTSIADGAWIRADVTRLEQVLINLVVNARDAMPAGGRVFIETADMTIESAQLVTVERSSSHRAQSNTLQPGRYVHIVVRDTGHGIEPATLDRMFEPFFTTKSREHATGLGLSTVHGIVQQGGGHISVQSEVGRGTTVEVFWPATELPRPQDRAADVRPLAAVDH